MNRIKQLRTERGIKQTELAKIINVSQAALSGYETGKYEADLATYRKIAEYFGVSVDYLLGGDVPAPVMTMDDFTFAMHNHSGQLTEKDKQILLAMAQQLSDAHKKKGSDGETDGDL